MLRLILCFFWAFGAVFGAGVGFDSMSPTRVVDVFSAVHAEAGRLVLEGDNLLCNGQGRWLRIRMNFSGPKLDDAGYVAAERAAMQRLRVGGWKLCAIVEWGPKDWKNGTRRDQRLPLDLREVYTLCRRLQALYGDAIDAWEIGNEPDITFVPENAETYAAYLKAAWLAIAAEPRGREAIGEGRWAGAAEAGGDRAICRAAACLQPLSSVRGFGRAGEKDFGREAQPGSTQGRALQGSAYGRAPIAPRLSPLAQGQEPRALVLMAPLSLPPGPWLELFVKNDGLGYTDGFNYHMYGYAGDFSGMYAAFERAVAAPELHTPVEVGSLCLGKETKNGPVPRGREARGDGRWAEKEARSEKREAGSAVAEVGDLGRLSLPPPRSATSATGEPSGGSRQEGQPGSTQGRALQAPGAFGSWLMSPSLEYLLYSPEARWNETRSWQVRVPSSSPVVIDHIVVEKVHAMKRYLSYMVEEAGNTGVCVGQAVVVLYNFSDKTVRGKLRLPAEARGAAVPRGREAMGDGRGAEKEARSEKREAGSAVAEVGDLGRLSLPPPRSATSATGEPSGGARQETQPGSTQGRALHGLGTSQGTGLASLPVFITEFGYAQLSGAAAKTAEGRARQRLWFEEVTRQGKTLGIEGMMAFFLPPYLETSAYEFGLAMEKAPKAGGSAPAPMGKQDTRKVVSLPKPADLSPQRLRSEGPFTESELELTLEPGGRLEIPVEYRFEGKSFDPLSISYVFEPNDSAMAAARWVSNLLPDPKGMKLEEAGRLDDLEGRGGKNAARLKGLPLVREEGERHASGAAWVTGDVAVEELAGGWRLTVRSIDETVFYPINVELPWPDGLPFEEHSLLRFVYRLLDESDPARTEQLDFYVRTANGNLYQVYPRLFATKDWQGYIEHKNNFTLTYYGRSNLPWRFAENEPIGLAFRLRPRKVPATYEVRDLGLIRYERTK